jgi:imidazolonepropionase-like amidohydrolase
MMRAGGDTRNATFESGRLLQAAGIPFAIQTGYEGYVPKTRVLIFEASIAVANGLGAEDALRAMTLTPAQLLGVADRVGSLKKGKDGDLVLFDGDPFEFTSHVCGVVIEGDLVSDRCW